VDKDDVWARIHGERAALADLLATLEPADWDTPSLCAGWRVRDVAAHVIMSPRTDPWTLTRAVIRSGGRFHRMTDREARRAGERPPAEILADYRRLDGSRRRPPGTSVLDPLLDVLVHTQDIAFPLGRRHPMPAEASRLAAERVWRVPGFLFPSRRVLSGVTLRATDTDWAKGDGPLVTGPMGALLLLATGRHPAARQHLHGEGLAELTARLPTPEDA
jgi:uncharacterized protein (TIGR03083 family)